MRPRYLNFYTTEFPSPKPVSSAHLTAAVRVNMTTLEDALVYYGVTNATTGRLWHDDDAAPESDPMVGHMKAQ
jgi:hypothetical protein